MTLSIVIVSYNARADLENCLASLQAAPPAIAHDVIVVDNASPDRSADAVRARFPAVRVIALDKNVGFAAGNNVGIKATTGDLVLLLNSDTLVAAGAIDSLVRRLQSHPAAAVAGPRLLDGHGRTEISWGPMISPFGELRQKTDRAALRSTLRACGALDRPQGRDRAIRRLGERRLPARPSPRRGSRRAPG